MDFLVLGRAALGAGDEDDPGLDEAHWSYMDAFADRMTARGPTLSVDRLTWTGSVHIVDVADGTAAHAFAAGDPYHRAGLFESHLIRRFDNRLGRTMWDVTPVAGLLPFLVLADGGAPVPRSGELPRDVQERLLVWGGLHAADGSGPTGAALGLLAPDEAAVRSLIAARPSLLGGCVGPELHAWEFGGRR